MDILGFEAYVDDEKKSEEIAGAILHLFDHILSYLKNYASDTFNISQFSDTFIISATSITMISMVASFLQKQLLSCCLISRGAITYGKVFHNGSQFIGPAITRAYNLEKSEALYPRVIIDPKCEENFDLKDNFCIKKDFDGYWYVWIMGVSKTEGVEQDALLIGNINALYEEHKNTKHRGKYTWLKNKADEVKEVRRKQEDLKKYKHKETYDILPFQDEIF